MSTAVPNAEVVHIGNVPLPTAEQLPDDPEVLKRMILELLATLQRSEQDKQQLRDRLDLLLRRLYGPRSERVNPDQLLLFDEPAEEPTPATPSPPPKKARPHGRRRLPENLPRRVVHHQLSDAERQCVCGHQRLDIGSDVSEQLDWRPASFFVWQHHVHKYLCPHCSKRDASANATPTRADAEPIDLATVAPSESVNVVSAGPIGPAIRAAARPAGPIDRGLPGAGLLAHVIVGKYFDHLPLHRHERIFARAGLERVAEARAADPRTLQRRLAAEGLSFKPLVHRVKMDLAGWHVQASSMPLTLLADVLGYADQAAFSKAFREAYGMPPLAWRRLHRPAATG